MIDARIDIDNIVVSWGESIKHELQMQALGMKFSIQEQKSFQAYKAVKNDDTSDSKHDYDMKKVKNVIPKAQKFKEDRVMLSPEQQKEELEKSLKMDEHKLKDSQTKDFQNKIKEDPRGQKDLAEIIMRSMDDMQTDDGIENALSMKDLEMALSYVLDQVSPLDYILIDIIDYFTMMSSGMDVTKDYLNEFAEPFAEVELWINSQKGQHTENADAKLVEDYQMRFCQKLKKSMNGLLEPKGQLLEEIGGEIAI